MALTLMARRPVPVTSAELQKACAALEASADARHDRLTRSLTLGSAGALLLAAFGALIGLLLVDASAEVDLRVRAAVGGLGLAAGSVVLRALNRATWQRNIVLALAGAVPVLLVLRFAIVG